MFRAIMIWLMFVAASARGQSESVLPEISGFWYMQTTSWFPVGTNMNFEYTEHVLQYSSEPEQLAYGLSWRALTNFDFEQIGSEVLRHTMLGMSRTTTLQCAKYTTST